MKKYYVETNVNMQPKNKAWSELQDFAHEQNGTLIHGDGNLMAFIGSVQKKVDEVNARYPRCTDLTFKSETRHHQVVSAAVYPDEAFTLTFLPVKKEILP